MKIMIYNWNNVLTDVIDELRNRGHEVYDQIDDMKKFRYMDVICVWNEVEGAGWREFITKAKKYKKKVILTQHGRYGSSRIYPPFNEKVLSDVVCVWGKNDKKRFIECGTPEEKIRVTGTPIFKHLKPKIEHRGINIVFSPEHWDGEVPENAIVAGTLRKMKGVNIITKCLEGEQSIESYDNPIVSNRWKDGHLEICADVLSTADIVVCISESTFELMAEILDIPVVMADIWIPKACGGDDRYLTYNRISTNACYKEKDISKLPDTIKYCLNHPDFLREERKQIAIGDGGINIKNPLEEIIKVIEEHGRNN